MEGLFSQIVTKEMAILAAAAISVMLFLGKVPWKGAPLNTTKLWKSCGIFILVIVCVGGAFVPGIRPEGEVGNALIFGFISALVAHLGRKILGPIFLKRLEGKEQPKSE